MTDDLGRHRARLSEAVAALESASGAVVVRTAGRLTARNIVALCELSRPCPSLDQRSRVVIKTFRDDPAVPAWESAPQIIPTEAATLEAIARCDPPGRAPIPLMTLDRPAALVMSLVDGTAIRQAPPAAIDACDPIGVVETLDALHGAADILPRESAESDREAALICADWLGGNDAAQVLAGIGREVVASALTAFPIAPSVHAARHGDLTTSNILAGPSGLGVVDFSDATVGDAHADLASLWLSLMIEAEVMPERAPHLEHFARRFVAAWRKSRPIVPETLAFYLARKAARHLCWIVYDTLRQPSASGGLGPARIASARAWLSDRDRIANVADRLSRGP